MSNENSNKAKDNLKLGATVINNAPLLVREDVSEKTIEQITRANASIFTIRTGLFAPILKCTASSKIYNDFLNNNNKRELPFEEGKIVISERLLTQQHASLLSAMLTVKEAVSLTNLFDTPSVEIYFTSKQISEIIGKRLNILYIKEKLKDLRTASIEMKSYDMPTDELSSNLDFSILASWSYNAKTGFFKASLNNVYAKIFERTMAINYKECQKDINLISNGFIQGIVVFLLTQQAKCSYPLSKFVVDIFSAEKRNDINETVLKPYADQASKHKDELLDFGITWDVSNKMFIYTPKRNIKLFHPAKKDKTEIASKSNGNQKAKKSYRLDSDSVPDIQGDENVNNQESEFEGTRNYSKADLPEWMTLKTESPLLPQMREYAQQIMDEIDIEPEFNKYKFYYLKKNIVIDNYEERWYMWLDNYRQRNGVKFRFPMDSQLTDEFKDLASKYNINTTDMVSVFTTFKNHSISKAIKSESWLMDWENWCINHMKRIDRDDVLSTKVEKKLNFDLIISSSDVIKEELEKQQIDWNTAVLNGISIHENIGYKQMRVSGRTQTILFYIASKEGVQLSAYGDEIIDAEVSNA